MDAASKTHSSEGELNVVFSFFYMNILGKFQSVFAGIQLMCFRFSLRKVLKFHGVGTAMMGLLTCILFSDGPLFSRMLAWRSAALVNRTRRLGPKTFVPFREIVTDSGGSASIDTQPNLRKFFAIATAFFVTTFLRHFVGLFLNLPALK